MNQNNTLPAGPLTPNVMKTQQNTQGFIEGTVTVTLNEIINCDTDEFLDLLSSKLTGSECLNDIKYIIIGHTETTVTLKVTGDGAYVINEE